MNAGEIVDRLVGLGYLRFTQPEHTDTVRSQLINSICRGYIRADWGDENDPSTLDRRIYAADSEDLAEGGVGSMILSMRRILEAEGVQLGKVEDIVHDGACRYEVIVNGRTWLIYDSNENPDVHDWGLALKRTLEITNKLLRDAQSQERAFGIHEANEAMIIFLTQDMYDLLQNSGITWSRDCKPYPPSAITEKGARRG